MRHHPHRKIRFPRAQKLLPALGCGLLPVLIMCGVTWYLLSGYGVGTVAGGEFVQMQVVPDVRNSYRVEEWGQTVYYSPDSISSDLWIRSVNKPLPKPATVAGMIVPFSLAIGGSSMSAMVVWEGTPDMQIVFLAVGIEVLLAMLIWALLTTIIFSQRRSKLFRTTKLFGWGVGIICTVIISGGVWLIVGALAPRKVVTVDMPAYQLAQDKVVELEMQAGEEMLIGEMWVFELTSKELTLKRVANEQWLMAPDGGIGEFDADILYFDYRSGELASGKLKMTVRLPDVDWNGLKTKIEDILGEEKDKYGVYVFDMKRQEGTGVNADRSYAPASIIKVPVAITALRQVDQGVIGLDQVFPMQPHYRAYNFDVVAGFPTGKAVTLREYLEWSIENSDNTANQALEFIVGGYREVNRVTQEELGATEFFRDPHTAQAKDIGRVFQGIYNQEYLSAESNEYLLYLLKHTVWWMQDGIPIGLPDGIQVAHKTGQLWEYSWEDAGIIYGEWTDYILVVINSDIRYASARPKVQEISKVVYEALNGF